jgi:hypothetical protein
MPFFSITWRYLLAYDHNPSVTNKLNLEYNFMPSNVLISSSNFLYLSSSSNLKILLFGSSNPGRIFFLLKELKPYNDKYYFINSTNS